MTERPTVTTTAGAPVADNQNSITAGPRGPLLMEGYQLIEKLARPIFSGPAAIRLRQPRFRGRPSPRPHQPAFQ
jgi:hypothetical protein